MLVEKGGEARVRQGRRMWRDLGGGPRVSHFQAHVCSVPSMGKSASQWHALNGPRESAGWDENSVGGNGRLHSAELLESKR